jgi:hypothetical protein
MIDPLGKIVVEVRSNAGVAALTTRVRAVEPVGGSDPDWATEIDPVTKVNRFKYRFVVLTRLGASRHKRAGMQWVRIGVRAYGKDPRDAAALYGAVSDAIHNIGPRKSASGVLVFRSFDDTGGEAAKDPDTGQPYEAGVIAVAAADRVVA